MSSTFERLSRFVRLEGCIRTRTAFRIGTGRALDAGAASDLPVMKDVYGLPFIPGSSLKGVVRSHVESLVRGLNHPVLRSCDPIEGIYQDSAGNWICVSPKDYSAEEKNRKKHTREIPCDLCCVCNTFGHPNFAARVRFKDLRLDQNTWHELMLQVRDGVAIDRETGTVSGNKKFDFEVVPPGVRFELQVIADNVEDWQLGLLFAGFTMLNDGVTRLGGATSRGLGGVSVELTGYMDAGPATLLAGAAQEQKDVDAFRARCATALKAVLEQKAG